MKKKELMKSEILKTERFNISALSRRLINFLFLNKFILALQKIKMQKKYLLLKMIQNL